MTNETTNQCLESLESLQLAATVLHHQMVRYNAQIEYIAAQILEKGEFPFKIEEIVEPITHKIAKEKGFDSGFPEWIIKENLSKISLLNQKINKVALAS